MCNVNWWVCRISEPSTVGHTKKQRTSLVGNTHVERVTNPLNQKKRTSSFLVFLSASLNLQGSSEFQCLNSKYHKSNELGLCLMSPKEKRTSPKEFEQTHQVHIYIYVYVYAHIQPPSWGVMFENTLPPPKKKGGRQPSSPKQNSEVLKPSKSITCSIWFFLWMSIQLETLPSPKLLETSLPDSTFIQPVPGSRFRLFFNAFFKS